MIRSDADARTPRSERRDVLVTDSDNGQNRAALAAVRALAAAGYRPAVATAARLSLASASRYCADRVSVPSTDDEGYAAAVRAELERRDYLCALPASDAAVLALEAPGRALLDKDELAQRASEVGLPAMPGQLFTSYDELWASRHDLRYPLVVKPAPSSATGGVVTVCVNTPGELRRVAEATSPLLVQPWVQASMRAVAGVVWDGRLGAAVHQRYVRTWPVTCGVASFAITETPAEHLEEPIVRLLEGYEGIFQAQFVGPYLVDLNPRVYGSLPLAVAAGANLPAIACELAAGHEVALQRARPGIVYRWPEGDLRHLISEARAGRLTASKALEAIRPRRATAHSVTSLRDPRPLFTRLAYAAHKA